MAAPYHILKAHGHTPSYSQQGSEERGGSANNDEQWSPDESDGELVEDGSRKRKRPMSVSCELCKARKVKCDRGQPSCGWCVRNKQVCEYKERKKPGLRAGYGRELEARLDRLESVLVSHGHNLSQLMGINSGSNNTSDMQISPRPPHPPEANIFAANPSAMTQAGIAETPNSMGQASYTPQLLSYTPQVAGMTDAAREAYTTFDYAQGTPADPYTKHDPALLQQQDGQSYFPNGSAADSTFKPARSAASLLDQDLPPYDLLYSLADLYFKHINQWCPVLHRRTTFEYLFGSTSLEEADRMLLHAMVATTLRYSQDSRLTPEAKADYYNVSKQKVLLYGLEHSSVKALQALTILALDLCGNSNGPPGWNLLALITRSAVQLGLSIEATSAAVSPLIPSIYTLRAMVLPEPTNFIEEEGRRRLFWMIYVLDRYTTLTTAFDFALDEKEIDRRLPCRDDLWSRNQAIETRYFRADERAEHGADRPENMGSFSFYVEVVGILSRIHQFLKKPVDIGHLDDVGRWQTEYRSLDNALNRWNETLPREYSNTGRLIDSSSANKNVNCGWVMLQACYHTTVIRLHSSAAYPARRSPIFSPSLRASKSCLAAVEALSTLCVFVKNSGMLNKLGPPFAFSVWVAARLLLVHSSTVEHQIDPTVQYFVSVLRELGTYWGVADRYARLLQQVLDDISDQERSLVNAPDGDHENPKSVSILADMRRCAYDLDFLISRQPRQLVPQHQYSGMTSARTPARTPAANELEYLDVFEFFNVPRLPPDVNNGGGSSRAGIGVVQEMQPFGLPESSLAIASNFNVENFHWDQSADWLMNVTPGGA